MVGWAHNKNVYDWYNLPEHEDFAMFGKGILTVIAITGRWKQTQVQTNNKNYESLRNKLTGTRT